MIQGIFMLLGFSAMFGGGYLFWNGHTPTSEIEGLVAGVIGAVLLVGGVVWHGIEEIKALLARRASGDL